MNNENERGGDAPRTRTLHPIRSRDAWRITEEEAEGLKRICVLDTETTGLDVDTHQVIEICAAMVMVDHAGRVRGIRSIGSGYVDPGEPLDATITELTGVTDADLAGQDIDRDKLASFIEECEGVISFNCAFDRPFVEKLLPNLKDVKWGCAMADVPWRKLGFEPGPQGFLVMQAGKFMPAAHRAQDDVLALVELLAHQCRDGETVMAKTLKAMDAPAWRFEARNAPYRFKDELRQHRYRWAADTGRKVWHKHVRDGEYDAELDWYRTAIGQEPAIVELPATQRYRAESTWKAA